MPLWCLFPDKALLENFESQHLLVSPLLNLLDSADYLVSVKAMDSLMVVCSLPDEAAAVNALTSGSPPLAKSLAGRLCQLFDAIPAEAEVTMVEEVKVNWMEAHHLHSSGQSGLPEFNGKSELVAFFSWLDFCDSLVKASERVIAEALANEMRDTFFEDRLQAGLLKATDEEEKEASGQTATDDEKPDAGIVEVVEKCDQDSAAGGHQKMPAAPLRSAEPFLGVEKDPVLLLALVGQCWVHLHSDGLAVEFAHWLFGERAAQPELRGVVTQPLKHALLGLCRSMKQMDVCLEALSLFDIIIERPCEPILQSLVLANVQNRGYFNAALAEANIGSWSEEEDEREKLRPGRHGPFKGWQALLSSIVWMKRSLW